ncbi:hypothetical protein [Neobacillus niacini]|uniref:hypothetical protein n=1 Tax=Neobacillus niacini TaxID=86668 RepID=UPI0021CAE758|nr:hypothetical protein [Neobacillus niacini]MCM3766232.1 hypothetical protein [Neobacillus niacini]
MTESIAFLVGIVDKMRQQGSDIAIIGYGVADLEQALLEKLNVDFTVVENKRKNSV